LTVREVQPEEVVYHFQGLHHLDPRKCVQPGGLPELTGRAFVIEGQGVQAVYVLDVSNGQAWCSAAKGHAVGVDLTAVLDEVMTAQAEGLQRIGIETARPGLMRKLKARGWKVSGWIMHKELM
jgi:hypothetical protein